MEPTLAPIDCQSIGDDGIAIMDIQLYFIILTAICSVGWTLNELNIWLRLCWICSIYNKESIQYHEQRDKELDEFVIKNNPKYFESMMDKGEWIEMTARVPVTNEKDTVIQDASSDHDALGLIPCCFEDIDGFHMKKLLLMQNEIGSKCQQCPCFMFGFSINIIWLFPFRHFWSIAVCDLSSVFWQRLCWFAAWHLVLFDAPWIVYCWLMHNLLQNALQDGLMQFIEFKAICCFATVIVIVLTWTVSSLGRILK